MTASMPVVKRGCGHNCCNSLTSDDFPELLGPFNTIRSPDIK
jgi:hypothetical protein